MGQDRERQRRLTLEFFKNAGIIPVPVRQNQKAPEPSWDARAAPTQDHSLVIRHFQNNHDANIGALFCGRFIDIDVDNNDLYVKQALRTFLPATTWRWGRKSKRESHFGFITTQDFDRGPFGSALRLLKNAHLGKASFSVEVRGGKPDSNMFAVMPGSMHPDNELYEWSSDADPTQMPPYLDPMKLVKGVRLAVAASLICNYWGPGVRNDMSLALAGLMWRIRASSLASMGIENELDVPDDVFCLRQDDAYDVIEFILKHADDNKADHRARRLNFINTWKKLDKEPSARVTGGKVLAEIVGGDEGKQFLSMLYRLLSDNEAAEELERMAEQFVIWYGTGMLVDLELVKKGHDCPWMSRTAARDSMGDRKIRIGDKSIPIVNILYDMPSVRRVFGFTFDPSSTEVVTDSPVGQQVNQWRGFAVEPCPEAISDADVAPLIDYLMGVLANDDQDAFDWIADWIAHLLQFPARKAGTSLVLLGVPGTGKTFLGEQVIAPIIGPAHATQLNNVDDLTAKFNSSMDSKIFVRCEEAIHAWQKNVSSQLKSLITDDFIWIEPKGINRFRKPNMMRFLFTSNEKLQALLIDPDTHERRYTVIEVSKRKRGDLVYWDDLKTWLAENRPQVMKWFLQRDIDWDRIRKPILTESKLELQRANRPPELQWINMRLQEGFPISVQTHKDWFDAFNSDTLTDKMKHMNTLDRERWPDRINYAALQRDYEQFLRSINHRVYSAQAAQAAIRRVIPLNGNQQRLQVTQYDSRTGQQVKLRPRVFIMPNRLEIWQFLRQEYGGLVEDLDDTDD